MSFLISSLTLFSLYHFGERSKKLDRGGWWLMLFGALLPGLDFLYGFVFGHPGVVWTPMWFHSPFYLSLGLTVISAWVWVWTRSWKKALQCYWPLVGLCLYLLLTLLSTERLPLLRPFSEASWSADWVNQGYLLPSLLILLLWVTKRWNRLKTRQICLVTLVILPLFLTFNLGIRLIGLSQLPAALKPYESLTAVPANILQTKWNVVTLREGKYHYSQLNIFFGWTQPRLLQSSNDGDLTQTLLEDPQVKALYVFGFKNPVVSTKLRNEQLQMEITELLPLKEVMWNKSMVITRNSNEQVVEITWKRGTLF